MPKEYEYAFQNFNKSKIISKIKKLKGVYNGTFLFTVQQFTPPLYMLHHSNYDRINIRVRDEEFRITMTIKIPTEDFDDEYEIIIDNFEHGSNLLQMLGCKKKSYYQKIREIWTIPNYNTEVVFDTELKCPEIMEIESQSQYQLEKIVKLFCCIL